MFWKLLALAAILQCSLAQQYQQKVAPGVPPQSYQEYNNQNYQPPPPPQQNMQQPPQQYQQPPQAQQYQPPPQQQYAQQVPAQQMPVQQVPVQQMPVQQVPVQQVPVQQVNPGQNPHQNPHAQHDPQLLNPTNMEHEKEHIQEHMEIPMDVSKMSEAELQFHYFKMHDADNNNKLDGCELIKSLIHWHAEQGHKQQQPGNPPVGEKIFTDDELVNLIDPILNMDDHNKDGYIDYPEFVRAQQKSQQQKGQ